MQQVPNPNLIAMISTFVDDVPPHKMALIVSMAQAYERTHGGHATFNVVNFTPELIAGTPVEEKPKEKPEEAHIVEEESVQELAPKNEVHNLEVEQVHLSQNEKKVLRALDRGPMSVPDLREKVGMKDPSQMGKLIARMREKLLIEPVAPNERPIQWRRRAAPGASA